MTHAFESLNRAGLRRLARRFRRNARGVAAVEFAMILPAMLAIYFGIVETGQGVMIDRKVAQLTRSLADLTAQAQAGQISNTEMSNIFDAAQTVMMPYNSVAPAMSVHHIVIDSAGVAKVCWSEQRNSTKLARGATVAIPADLRLPNTSIMMAEATYEFTPVVGWIIKGGPLKIGGDPIYMRPRLGKSGGTANIEQIERVGVAMCPGFS